MSMKKLILLPLLLLFAVAAFCQKNNFELGIQSGPSISSFRGNEIIKERHDNLIGYAVGLTMEYYVSNRWSILAGAGYELKGTTGESKVIDNNSVQIGAIDYRSTFDYINLPILLRYSNNIKNAQLKYFFNAGAYFGYLVKQIENSDGRPEFSNATYDNTDNFKRLDVGLSAGGGMMYPISDKLSISAELRNNLGLRNLSELPVFGNGSIKTNSTVLLLGASFNLSKSSDVETFYTPKF